MERCRPRSRCRSRCSSVNDSDTDVGVGASFSRRDADVVKLVAVLLSRYNAEATIGFVIDYVRASCPDPEIVVFDNNSTDRSAAISADKGVRIVQVSRQGKGNVVRAMLKKVEAD